MVDRKSLTQFFLGSFIISVSAGFGLVKSYSGSVPWTILSLIFFLVGFRVCQNAVSSRNSSILPDRRQMIWGLEKWREIAFFFVGASAMGQGFIFLTSSISGQVVQYSFIGGFLILGGYVPMHIAFNKTLV